MANTVNVKLNKTTHTLKFKKTLNADGKIIMSPVLANKQIESFAKKSGIDNAYMLMYDNTNNSEITSGLINNVEVEDDGQSTNTISNTSNESTTPLNEDTLNVGELMNTDWWLESKDIILKKTDTLINKDNTTPNYDVFDKTKSEDTTKTPMSKGYMLLPINGNGVTFADLIDLAEWEVHERGTLKIPNNIGLNLGFKELLAQCVGYSLLKPDEIKAYNSSIKIDYMEPINVYNINKFGLIDNTIRKEIVVYNSQINKWTSINTTSTDYVVCKLPLFAQFNMPDVFYDSAFNLVYKNQFLNVETKKVEKITAYNMADIFFIMEKTVYDYYNEHKPFAPISFKDIIYTSKKYINSNFNSIKHNNVIFNNLYNEDTHDENKDSQEIHVNYIVINQPRSNSTLKIIPTEDSYINIQNTPYIQLLIPTAQIDLLIERLQNHNEITKEMIDEYKIGIQYRSTQFEVISNRTYKQILIDQLYNNADIPQITLGIKWFYINGRILVEDSSMQIRNTYKIINYDEILKKLPKKILYESPYTDVYNFTYSKENILCNLPDNSKKIKYTINANFGNTNNILGIYEIKNDINNIPPITRIYWIPKNVNELGQNKIYQIEILDSANNSYYTYLVHHALQYLIIIECTPNNTSDSKPVKNLIDFKNFSSSLFKNNKIILTCPILLNYNDNDAIYGILPAVINKSNYPYLSFDIIDLKQVYDDNNNDNKLEFRILINGNTSIETLKKYNWCLCIKILYKTPYNNFYNESLFKLPFNTLKETTYAALDYENIYAYAPNLNKDISTYNIPSSNDNDKKNDDIFIKYKKRFDKNDATINNYWRYKDIFDKLKITNNNNKFYTSEYKFSKLLYNIGDIQTDIIIHLDYIENTGINN